MSVKIRVILETVEIEIEGEELMYNCIEDWVCDNLQDYVNSSSYAIEVVE